MKLKKILEELQEHCVLIKQKDGRLLSNRFAIYYTSKQEKIPFLMEELGRQRELAFAKSGGGTGKELDIDEYDVYATQIILWDVTENKLAGGYRYFILNEVPKDHGIPRTPMFHLFDASDLFLKEYAPKTIELGRAFLSVDYSGPLRRSAFPALLVGLAALTIQYEECYFLGKVTMYPSYNADARNYIMTFLEVHYKSKKELLVPKKEFVLPDVIRAIKKYAGEYTDTDVKADYQKLKRAIEDLRDVDSEKIKIPVLIDFYMGLTPKMQSFGIAKNPDCGDQEEVGIFIKIRDIDKTSIAVFTKYHEKQYVIHAFMRLKKLKAKIKRMTRVR